MKPVVQYIPNKNDSIIVGFRGYIVHTLDHYSDFVTNGHPVSTSRIVSHDPTTGEFETLNTTYRPASN